MRTRCIPCRPQKPPRLREVRLHRIQEITRKGNHNSFFNPERRNFPAAPFTQVFLQKKIPHIFSLEVYEVFELFRDVLNYSDPFFEYSRIF
jgi:hypothetical protein